MLYGVATSTRASPSSPPQLDLTDLLDRPTGKLSAGQKTRVSLAKALINRPDVLLLDEPTASLDPDTADWVRTQLERYRDERGATMLIASHNMAEVERLCERVIMMKQGKIDDDDTPAGLLARYGRDTLEEVFLDVARGRDEAARGARDERRCFSLPPRRRDGAALLVSAALVVAAAGRADLLAGGADADVGLPADLSRRAGEHARAGRRRVHRRRAAVGHPVSRPARLFHVVPRRDVVAQSRQPDDLAAARRRVRRRADGHEHHPARDRHGAGDAPGDRLLRLQFLGARLRARGLLR